MADDNDKIQDLFTGRNNNTENNPDLIAAKQWGEFIERHQAQENITPDTNGFMAKVKQTGLLEQQNNVSPLKPKDPNKVKRFPQPIAYAMAATLFVVVLVPAIYLNQQPSFPEYGEVRSRGLASQHQTINVNNATKTAQALQQGLKQYGVSAKIYNHKDNLLLEAFIDEGKLTNELQTYLKAQGIKKHTEGVLMVFIND